MRDLPYISRDLESLRYTTGDPKSGVDKSVQIRKKILNVDFCIQPIGITVYVLGSWEQPVLSVGLFS